jgi:hypothetical protein
VQDAREARKYHRRAERECVALVLQVAFADATRVVSKESMHGHDWLLHPLPAAT